jgi:hypothetical protein
VLEENVIVALISALREARPYVWNAIHHGRPEHDPSPVRSEMARGVLARVDAALRPFGREQRDGGRARRKT